MSKDSQSMGLEIEDVALFKGLPLIGGTTLVGGGLSQGPYESFNLALHVGDERAHVLENRRRLCAHMNCPVSSLVGAEQVHGLQIVEVHKHMAGQGATSMEDAPRCDALFTREVGLPLIMCVADCMPLVIYDKKAHAVGVVHAGWRGIKGELPRLTIKAMMKAYGSRAEDFLVYGGPHIQRDSFEVSDELGEAFAGDFGEGARFFKDGKSHVDLAHCLRESLQRIAINLEQIELSSLDTMRNKQCFSYRRDGGVTGRMAGFACLLERPSSKI